MPFHRLLGKFSHFAVLAMGCGQILAASTPPPALPPIQEIDSPTPAYVREQAVIEQTCRLVRERDTAGLEALAGQLRKDREHLDGGTWILSTFYDTACELSEDEATAHKEMEFFERWAHEHPGNITAQVCLAKALTSYAWMARGSGWANSVTDEGWRLFRERLGEARKALEEAAKLEEKCPGWSEAAQRVALGQGWKREKYMEMISTAILKEPSYGRYYTNACYWLLPRWYGETGDFEQWITGLADACPAETRDRQYAFLVWMADRMPVSGEIIFAPGRLDWNRTKKGFDLWVKEHPDNLMVRFEYIRLALLANDRAAVREQFGITGGRYFAPMWQGREQFEKARQFAFFNGPNPQIDRKRVHSNFKTDPKILARVKFVSKIASGFIGGVLAGIFLLVLGIQCKQVWPGVTAAVMCVLLAAPFGTLAALLPAVVLLLHLRRQLSGYPPEPAPPSGWMVLLWVVVFAGLYFVLQMGAAIPACIPLFLENGASNAEEAIRVLSSDGTVLLITTNAAWIGFLGLLIVCRSRYCNGWKNRLGLHCFAPVPGVVWSLVALFLLLGLGHILDHFMDERSRTALKLITFGLQSPVSFYLAIGFAAPVFEELLFRGYAYSGWIDKMGFWGTATVSALFFTLCHIQYGGVHDGKVKKEQMRG